MRILPHHFWACGHLPALLFIKYFRGSAECTLGPSLARIRQLGWATRPDAPVWPDDPPGRARWWTEQSRSTEHLGRATRSNVTAWPGPDRTGDPQATNPAAMKHLGEHIARFAHNYKRDGKATVGEALGWVTGWVILMPLALPLQFKRRLLPHVRLIAVAVRVPSVAWVDYPHMQTNSRPRWKTYAQQVWVTMHNNNL